MIPMDLGLLRPRTLSPAPRHSPGTYNQHHSAETVVEIQLLPHRVVPAKGLLQGRLRLPVSMGILMVTCCEVPEFLGEIAGRNSWVT